MSLLFRFFNGGRKSKKATSSALPAAVVCGLLFCFYTGIYKYIPCVVKAKKAKPLGRRRSAFGGGKAKPTAEGKTEG